MYILNMKKLDYKCRRCGSEEYEEKDSVQRITVSSKRNVRRRRCLNPECGHRSTQPYRRDVARRWVQYMAIKLRYKGLSYREISEKLATFIKQTGFAKLLGRKKYSHESVRVWIEELGAPYLSLSKQEQDELIEEDYFRTYSVSALDSLDSKELRRQEEKFFREYGETTGLAISRLVLKYTYPFDTLEKDTWEIDPFWCMRIKKMVINVSEDSLSHRVSNLLKRLI